MKVLVIAATLVLGSCTEGEIVKTSNFIDTSSPPIVDVKPYSAAITVKVKPAWSTDITVTVKPDGPTNIIVAISLGLCYPIYKTEYG